MSMRIAVGKGSCGIAAGAQKVYDALAPLPSGTDNALQRALLEAEGVPFLPDGRVDMNSARWTMEELGETL